MYFNESELIASKPKEVIAGMVIESLGKNNLAVCKVDLEKPWGVEIKTDPHFAPLFIKNVFGGEVPAEIVKRPVNPNIMVIENLKQLSYHVHARKHAFVKNIGGKGTAKVGLSDFEPKEILILHPGATLDIPVGLRHRMGGLYGYVIIAEIARDTDPENPTDEDDTRRIIDDFGRQS